MEEKNIFLLAESKKGLKSLFKNRIFFILFILTLVINIFLWIFNFLYYQVAKDITVIHYSVLSGVDWLDSKKFLFIFPLVGFIFFILNAIISFFLHKRNEKILLFFLTATSLLVNIFLLISSFLIFTL